MTDTRVPAEVFHPAQLIADEAIARDWSIWDFVDRIGTLNPPVDVLALQLFASSAEFDDVSLRVCKGLSEHWTSDMQRVFGIDAEIWQGTLDLCNAHPDRIAPLDEFAIGWFRLNDEEKTDV